MAGASNSALQTDGTYINQTNSQLTSIAVLSPIWVNFSVSENEWQFFHDQLVKGVLREPKGQRYTVEVVLVDGSVFPSKGQITFAEPSFNAQTGTFLIRASLDNPRGLLRPNQYVRVHLKGAVRPNAILVPQRAIRQGAKGHYVWVVDKEKKAAMRPVVVGDWYGNDWLVLEGLSTGEQVVVDGGLTLHPGVPVVTKPYVAAPEALPAADPSAATEQANASEPTKAAEPPKSKEQPKAGTSKKAGGKK